MIKSIYKILLNNDQIMLQSMNKMFLKVKFFSSYNRMVSMKNFSTKKKKIVELKTSRIDFEGSSLQNKKEQASKPHQEYLQIRHKIQSLPWEDMLFDELCSLDKELLDGLEIQLKKSKFNVSDEQFLASQLKNGKQIPLKTYGQLDRYYKKLYSLLKNTNDYYDQFPIQQEIKKGYLHEIYLTDLKNDKELNFVLAKFVKHIAKPQKLQNFAEPTFVKYLLTIKRELLLQGINFQTKAQEKETKKKKEQVIESYQYQQLPRIKILEVLNYQYEFWQDVKHNRSKNGSQQNFLIQTREVPNPNQSVLLRELYPTIKVKYIARHKPLRQKEMCFCLKADLLIEINQKLKRRVKVQWKGPSNRIKQKNIKSKKQSEDTQNQQQPQEQVPKVNYLVIDYEGIYDGNSTIKPVFYF